MHYLVSMEISLSALDIAIAILGGLIAGGINTLAGSGSAITLSILHEVLGLPINIANGSNRVGVLAQSITTNLSFFRHGKLQIVRKYKLQILLIFLGAIYGVYLASIISNEVFKEIFKYLLVVLFFIILIRPKRWLSKTDELFSINPWIGAPIFFALGIYGGFIQMGMGVFFLAIFVLLNRTGLIDSNVIKAFTVGLYTIFVLAFFHWKGLVHWHFGLLVGVGQAIGGYAMAEFSSRSAKAGLWAYRLLVVVVFVLILRVFGAF